VETDGNTIEADRLVLRRWQESDAARLLDHAFVGGLTEVWAVMFPANVPFRGVMTRLGMTDLGVRERWYPGESQVMRITAEEWSRGRP